MITKMILVCTATFTLISIIYFVQNESSSIETTSSNNAKEVDFDTKVEGDRSKRFDYLLKQTEIFSHFISPAAPGPKSPLKVKAGRPKRDKEKSTADAGE